MTNKIIPYMQANIYFLFLKFIPTVQKMALKAASLYVVSKYMQNLYLYPLASHHPFINNDCSERVSFKSLLLQYTRTIHTDTLSRTLSHPPS